MPNWKTHIEIGKRLNKKMNYYIDSDLNLFLLGSILPDVNNEHIIRDISKKIEYDITHFGGFLEKGYIKFYKKYKKYIDNKNPIFLGYLVHLYTDYLWNKDFCSKIKVLNILNNDKKHLMKMKQNDFKVYNNKFINNKIELINLESVLKEIKHLDEVFIEKEDVLKTIKFLDKENLYKSEMKLYSIEELDALVSENINNFLNLINFRVI